MIEAPPQSATLTDGGQATGSRTVHAGICTRYKVACIRTARDSHARGSCGNTGARLRHRNGVRVPKRRFALSTAGRTRWRRGSYERELVEKMAVKADSRIGFGIVSKRVLNGRATVEGRCFGVSPPAVDVSMIDISGRYSRASLGASCAAVGLFRRSRLRGKPGSAKKTWSGRKHRVGARWGLMLGLVRLAVGKVRSEGFSRVEKQL